MLNETGVQLDQTKPWDFPPNWSDRYDVTYEYLTDVFTSRSGSEQRRALRNTARKSLSYTALATANKLRSLERLMAAWQKHYFVTPEYTAGVYLTAPVFANSSTMTMNPRPHWMVPGGVVVFESPEGIQARQVEAVNEDTNVVTFSESATYTSSTGSKVYPGLVGRVAGEMRTARPTDDVATVAVDYSVLPGSEVEEPSGTPERMWRGQEVVMVKPNYLTPPSVSFGYDVDSVDYSRGLTKVFNPIAFSTRTWQAEYLGATPELAHRLLKTFVRAKGRRGAFYMPTWKDDLPLVDPITQGSFRIRVRGLEPAQLMANDKVYRNIALFLNDGTVVFNQVEQIFPVLDSRGQDSILTLSEAWTLSAPLTQVVRVSWMPLWRFASDRFLISWVTNGVARLSPTMISLEDVTIEDIE